MHPDVLFAVLAANDEEVDEDGGGRDQQRGQQLRHQTDEAGDSLGLVDSGRHHILPRDQPARHRHVLRLEDVLELDVRLADLAQGHGFDEGASGCDIGQQLGGQLLGLWILGEDLGPHFGLAQVGLGCSNGFVSGAPGGGFVDGVVDAEHNGLGDRCTR